jgi:excisionase family DNA binding protein
MKTTIITQGLTVEELLSSVRETVRHEIKSIPQAEKVKPFLSLEEASEFTGLSKSTLYRLTSERKIPHIKRGKLLFDRQKLTGWLEEASQ